MSPTPSLSGAERCDDGQAEARDRAVAWLAEACCKGGDSMAQESGRPTVARLGLLVYRLHLALREAFEERLAGYGITPADWGALDHCREGINTPAGLADCLGVNRAAVTRILDRLEEAGLMTRTPNAADGRSVLLDLTESGERTADRAANALDQLHRDYTAALTEPECVQLMNLLHKTIRTLPGKKRPPEDCPDG